MRRRWFGALRAGSGALLCVAASIATAADARPDRVAFSAYVDGHWRIYTQALDGTAAKRVADIDGPQDQGAPRFSPEGARLAFEVTGIGLTLCQLREPHEARAEGDGGCRSLQLPGEPPVRPAWRHGTTDLVFSQFVTQRTSEDAELYSTSGQPGDRQNLLRMTGILDSPDITRDGRQLAYSVTSTSSLWQASVQVVQQIWATDLQTGRSRQLTVETAQNLHPRWSPDGTRIAFASNRGGGFDLWLYDVASHGVRRLTRGEGTKTWPAWSADGERIIYSHTLGADMRLQVVDIGSGIATPFRAVGLPAGTRLRDPDWQW